MNHKKYGLPKTGCHIPAPTYKIPCPPTPQRAKAIKTLRHIAEDLQEGYDGFGFLVGYDFVNLPFDILEGEKQRKQNGEEMRDDGLTEQEGKVADALVTAWNEFCKLEQWHPSDKPCFCEAIHQCQQILAMRIVQRAYPEGWPIKAVKP